MAAGASLVSGRAWMCRLGQPRGVSVAAALAEAAVCVSGSARAASRLGTGRVPRLTKGYSAPAASNAHRAPPQHHRGVLRHRPIPIRSALGAIGMFTSTATPTTTPETRTDGRGSSVASPGANPSTPRGATTGEIHIIIGPMFAGKTTALLERVAVEEANGLHVTLVKSCKDSRYSDDEIVSHDGVARRCNAVARLADLQGAVGDEQWTGTDVIAIDEAQFIPDLVAFCTAAADVHRKKVIVAGLDGDFRRNRFGPVLDLLPLCDSVTKLAGRCAGCAERPALFSMRLAVDKSTVELVGGADLYKPVCRACYVAGAGGDAHS